MKHPQLIKSASLVAFTLVLAGCGSTQYSSNPIPGYGQTKALAPTYQNAEGNAVATIYDKTEVIGGVTVTYSEISGEALVRAYSTIGNSGNSGEYLAFVPGPGDGVQDLTGDFEDFDSFWEVRDTENGAPVIIQYAIDKTDTSASARATVNLIESMGSTTLNVGDQFTLNFGADDVATAVVTDNGFSIGSQQINLGDNVDYTGYTSADYCSGVQYLDDGVGADYCSVTVNAQLHLWKAEHAALYFMNHDSAQYSDNELPNFRIMAYGDLTRRENLPAAGLVSYDVNAIGTYIDKDYDGYDMLLQGEGIFEANFNTSIVKVQDMQMRDHEGNNFILFDDLEMELRPGYNFFANFGCENGSGTGGSCDDGTVTYQADSSFALDNLDGEYLEAKGSFYGPNGEEVAGTIYHGDGIQDIEIGFIGEQQQD